MSTSIVVPVDGSAASEHLVSHAAALRRAVDAEVTLVHVAARDRLSLLKGGDYLSGLRERCASILPEARTALLTGEPGVEVVNYAMRIRSDLLALSTRGSSPLRRVLFGTTAIEILRSSPIPLYVIRPEWQARPIRTLLAAFDESPDAAGALPFVKRLAQGCGARLQLMPVLADPRATGKPRKGDPAVSILGAARESGADLIAIGVHGRRDTDSFFFGSVAESVLLKSEVPVLLPRTARGCRRHPLTVRGSRA
jgi:nucleotide-binding universal stress UspA family protein